MTAAELLEAARLVESIGQIAIRLLKALGIGDWDEAHSCIDQLRAQAAGKAAAESSAATSAMMAARRGK